MMKVQAGEYHQLGLLYERHHKDLFAYFFRCTGDKLKSEDLVHNVFLRIMKYAKKFSGTGKFVYWMFSIARNVWIDEYRKDKVLKNHQSIGDLERKEEGPDPSQLIEKKEKQKMLSLALQSLSPEKREAIVMSRFQGLKYAEIAEIAGCSENAIKSRVQRGLIELREIILKIESS